MEYYDVIIVGAGIAGCGLAYNLKRIGYEGKVLVIDGKESDASSGHRNTFNNIIREYDMPFLKKFKGFKIGIHTNILMTIDHELYCIDYQKVCDHLLKKSNIIFKKEKALHIEKKILYTNKNKFKFKYLIDCSGNNLFLRKIFKLPMPFRFWLAKIRTIKNNIKLDEDYCYYLYGKDYNLEEVCILKNKIFQADWYYSKNIDFKLIKPSKKTFLNTKIPNKEIITEKKAVTIVTPVLPLVYKKRFAFLGDSFGNTSPLSVFGVECVLDTSKILATAIKKNNLQFYKKVWQKKYLEGYIQRLAIKMDSNHNHPLLEKMKNYPDKFKILNCLKEHPEYFLSLVKNQYKMPKVSKKFKKIFPKSRPFWLIYHYTCLKIKYFFMKILY